jgi:phytoene synthase
MVNDRRDRSERDLARLYAPPDRRPAFEALLALDDRLGELVRAAREPLVGQMRLTWWHQALTALDTAPPPAEPLLADLATIVLPVGVTGAALADQVEGWEALLDGEPPDGDALVAAAEARGGRLFAAAARAMGGGEVPPTAGAGWALADFARRLSDRQVAAMARDSALPRVETAMSVAWPGRLRALGAMVLTARENLRDTRPEGHPRRVARLAWHRLTGR